MWVPVVIAVVTAGLVAVLAVVFTLAMTRRARPGLGPRPPAPTVAPSVPPPPGGVPVVEGTWNAMIAGGGLIGAMGGTLNATFGRIDLVDGTVSFTRTGREVPEWRVPCRQVRIRQLDLLAPKGDIELNGPMGQVRCTVSREHVNRATTNGFKTLREQGYAREFVHAVLTHGAVHG